MLDYARLEGKEELLNKVFERDVGGQPPIMLDEYPL
jgi:hypothetical protein